MVLYFPSFVADVMHLCMINTHMGLLLDYL